MKRLPLLGILPLFLLSCSSDDLRSTLEETVAIQTDSAHGNALQEGTNDAILRVSGQQLIDSSGNAVQLKGVAFSNHYWWESPEPPPHHTEVDYDRVKEMGFNSIRFYLDYRWFEDDQNPYVYKQTGWDWLDQNIRWAKERGIYLVVNMHAPQGRFVDRELTGGLWTNPENQERLLALWKEIARRYKDEATIAGFGPVNDPRPTESLAQWTSLAQRCIDAIRSAGSQHPLFIERTIQVGDSFVANEDFNFPDVTGQHLVYEFHMYEPIRYTHQLMDFSNLPDGGHYPDDTKVEAPNGTWYTATYNNPTLAPGSTGGWKWLEGEKFKITDPSIAYAAPAINVDAIVGQAYFDNIAINEYDKAGDFVRTIFYDDLENGSEWGFWSQDQSGFFRLAEGEGRDSPTSLFVEGTRSQADVTHSFKFIPTLGYSYQINGWAKGVDLAEEGACGIQLFFFQSPTRVLTRTKTLLEYEIGKYTAWAASRNRALYMGEFGTGAPTFENDKGGLQYVEDALAVSLAENLSFAFHTYADINFGIYRAVDAPLTSADTNQELIDVFKDQLRH